MPSDNPNTQRWHAWLNRHAADRTRIGPMTMLRSIVANVDRERAHAGVTRTVYVGAALLVMETLTPGERHRFLRRYAELIGA